MSAAHAGVERDAVLVADIRPGADSAFTSSANFLAVDESLFFVATDGIHGEELWRHDTATGSTEMVADIDSRTGYSGPDQLVALGGEVFFAAGDAVHGSELWKSDGTAAGTVLVKDVVPGDQGSAPENLTVVGDALFFTTRSESYSSTQLWKSDGTPDGTVLVKDVNPGAEYVYLDDLTAVGDAVFFTADDGTHGSELWRSDGTPGGTALVEDLRPGAGGSWPEKSVAHDGRLYFTAYDGTTDAGSGDEVQGWWTSDGTPVGTFKLTDLPEEPGSYAMASQSTVFGGDVFITANHQMWRTNGTAAGTEVVGAVGTGAMASPQLYAGDGSMFFAGGGTSLKKTLWKTDGSAVGTIKVADVPWSGYGDLSGFTAIGSTMYFVVWGADGRELWSSDGTSAGTGLVVDMNPTFKPYGDPDNLTRIGDTTYFSAFRTDVGRELFRLTNSAPVDVTPPDTTITSGPDAGATIATSSVTFGFAGTVGDTSKLQCSLDGAAFVDCVSPVTFSNLSDGSHTVAFRAVDAAGNIDPTPAQRTFGVASTPTTPPPSTPSNPTPAPVPTTPAPPTTPTVSNQFVLPAKAKADLEKGTLALTIELPGPGRLQLEQVGGTSLKGQSKTVTKAGGTTLVLTPTKQALRKMKKAARAGKIAKLKVTARVTFAPVGGSASTQQRAYVLKLK